MPHAIAATSTFDDLENEALFTRAALKADPDARVLLSRTDHWLADIDAVRRLDRAAREQAAEADASRVVANHRLDTACRNFGDELHVAVGKDHTSARWLQFFSQAVGKFVRQALPRQVQLVQGWLTSKDEVLEKHRAPLMTWSSAASAALVSTAGLAQARGAAWQAREALAEHLTQDRDGLHEALAAIARSNHLGRDWPDSFYRVTRRRAAVEEAPETPPTPVGPPPAPGA